VEANAENLKDYEKKTALTVADNLTDEERAIVAFLESYFEKQGMRAALAMLRNPETKIEHLRALIDGYRELFQRERQ
jgi:hypothetical protein